MLDPTAADSVLLAQGMTPVLDGMYWLTFASRVLHILGSIVLVGGLFYLRMIVVHRVEASEVVTADPWYAGGRAAWAKWVGIATVVLIVTGLFNYLYIIKTHEKLAASYHMLAGTKMLLALVVFFLAALLAGRTPLAEQFRQKMKFWLTACLLVSIVVVATGSLLRSYPRVAKPIDGPQLIAPAQ